MATLWRSWVTLGFCAICAVTYAVIGPATSTTNGLNSLDVLGNIFRHGDAGHLITNLLIFGFAGVQVEKLLGANHMLVLVIAIGVISAAVQMVLVGPGFAGFSGPAYGVAAYLLVTRTAPPNIPFIWAIFALVLGLEAYFLWERLAILTHISAILTGGGYAMFNKLFGSGTPSLKPMELSHIGQVVQIIAQTDEDDAAEAEEMFFERGVEDMYVLATRGKVIGVTGFSMDPDTDDVAWLSWTYLTEERQNEGLGSDMMNDLLGMLKDVGVRKIFIATSDYKEAGQPIYAAAHKMYEDFGAEKELTVPGYHGRFEAKIVYGLENPEFGAQPMAEQKSDRGLAIGGLTSAPESDDVYGMTWDETPNGDVDGFDEAIAQARKKNARMLLLVLSSDLSRSHEAFLEEKGCTTCGKLNDFYGMGLHQIWWVCSIT